MFWLAARTSHDAVTNHIGEKFEPMPSQYWAFPFSQLGCERIAQCDNSVLEGVPNQSFQKVDIVHVTI